MGEFPPACLTAAHMPSIHIAAHATRDLLGLCKFQNRISLTALCIGGNISIYEVHVCSSRGFMAFAPSSVVAKLEFFMGEFSPACLVMAHKQPVQCHSWFTRTLQISKQNISDIVMHRREHIDLWSECALITRDHGFSACRSQACSDFHLAQQPV